MSGQKGCKYNDIKFSVCLVGEVYNVSAGTFITTLLIAGECRDGRRMYMRSTVLCATYMLLRNVPIYRPILVA